jgi:predicted secreted hydrolase
VSPQRRGWLRMLATLAAGAGPDLLRAAPASAAADINDDPISPARTLVFPRDHGAHPGARIEWWYATGWLATGNGAPIGWQITFFRSRTGLGQTLPGRFAPRQILLAHAAISEIATGRHRHAQRVARWAGDERTRDAHALRADTGVAIGRWQFQRTGVGAPDHWQAAIDADEIGLRLVLDLTATQPLLLQGAAGYSRKGPAPEQASHYYSTPQLDAAARISIDGRAFSAQGRGWLDHEWSDHLLAPEAVGWDWLGINLDDGSALTAFRLRRRDGSTLWAGGSHRRPGAAARIFEPSDVDMRPGRTWTSPATGARYPVEWALQTPAGAFTLRALLDGQELAARGSAVYWEGLSELLEAGGKRAGLGYLEMTGYAGRPAV